MKPKTLPPLAKLKSFTHQAVEHAQDLITSNQRSANVLKSLAAVRLEPLALRELTKAERITQRALGRARKAEELGSRVLGRDKFLVETEIFEGKGDSVIDVRKPSSVALTPIASNVNNQQTNSPKR